MNTYRYQLLRWFEQEKIPAGKMDAALETAGLLPDSRDWSRFLDRMLLATGILSLALSVIFFFAYNWQAMDRLVKFGLVESLLLLSLGGYWYFGSGRPTGKLILTAAAILLGGLMALFGQTYQTGADTWQLFAGWAVLISPWVIISRFSPLWLLWAVLVNLSIYLYFTVFSPWWWFHTPTESMLWVGFFFNTLLLILWEWGAKHFSWLDSRWAVRLVAVAGGVAATILAALTIIDWMQGSRWNILLYLAWCAGIYFGYRHVRQDLFMLAGLCLSGIIVITMLLARILLDISNAGGLLFIALAVVAMSAFAATWLKNVHKEMGQ